MSFADFYAGYPRKVARHAALALWERMSFGDREAAMAALPAHVAYWRAAGTAQQFIPHARTWLHQRRWEDEIEMPEPVEAEWWRTDRGVLKKGAECGVSPRPGEDMAQFKQRVVDALVKGRAA